VRNSRKTGWDLQFLNGYFIFKIACIFKKIFDSAVICGNYLKAIGITVSRCLFQRKIPKGKPVISMKKHPDRKNTPKKNFGKYLQMSFRNIVLYPINCCNSSANVSTPIILLNTGSGI